MFSENNAVNIGLTILLFPLLFQQMLLEFSWGSMLDSIPVLILKRVFLLLPAATCVAACWIIVASLITIIFRYKRLSFVVALILTCWDYLKSLAYFFGGIFKALLTLVLAILGLLKIILLIIWALIKDIIVLPLKAILKASRDVSGSSVPWIAVVMTLVAATLESLIFTPIITPVVLDIVPVSISILLLQVILFIIIFTLVLASFAVLTVTFSTVKKKQIGSTIMIFVIELIVIGVEVMFLYREFVDALVPWFAQYNENFVLGPLGTIGIAFVAWVGVRAMVWFLFASHGAPIIMSIIQGKQIASDKETRAPEKLSLFESSKSIITDLKIHSDWLNKTGKDIIDAILVPPMQILGATLNFLVLLLYSRHMFTLPFHTVSDMKPAQELVNLVRGKVSGSHEPDRV
ncbi:hypothetical protein JW948_10335 [bacterium]|nr:hypothetical protein [bacterium]